jgi:predicted ATPase
MSTISKDSLIFTPSLDTFAETREGRPLTVISGPNNSGKSLVLKWLKRRFGRDTYLIGTNRFYHVYHFSTGVRDPRQLDNFENQFNQSFSQDEYNHEQNFYDLNSVIGALGDKKRDALFKLCGELIGSTFQLKRLEDDNELSARYIDMDGQNLSVGSTGTRLLMTILGICMDERYQRILIDEPELGLGPRVQQELCALLEDNKRRAEYFPHLKQIFISTHSHLFLSRMSMNDNFVVTKTGVNIALKQVELMSDFHRLQFNLLGNSLESMFFPSAIVVVEGKTDYEYLERILALKFPGRRITVIPANGDVKRVVFGLSGAFGEITKSPFRQRLFVVLDSVHQRGLSAELQAMGVHAEHVICWDKNGIEYVYPATLMASVFACDAAQIASVVMEGDVLKLNGIEKKKNDLKDEILKALDSTTELPEELRTKLLKPIEDAIG